MSWHSHLQLHYRMHEQRCVAIHTHNGPLRILKSHYPEGKGICHNVFVHPPAGLAAGDSIEMQIHLEPACHAVLTTPGASRFYRSEGEVARQNVQVCLDQHARLEWCPLETLLYNGCQGSSQMQFDLAAGSSLLYWDVYALGLPLSDLPFQSGEFQQHVRIPGHWSEKWTLNAQDHLLIDSPLGLHQQKTLATMLFVSADVMTHELQEKLLAQARAHFTSNHVKAGASCPNPHVVCVRMLAPLVEPVMHIAQAIRHAWRLSAWDRPAVQPRIWST